jgi:hypothetical protein
MRYPMPAPTPVPARRSGMRALPIVGVVAVVAGLLLFRMLTAVSVSVPDQIDGVQRVTEGSLVNDLERRFETSSFSRYHPVVGMYGTPDLPEFFFVAAKGTESPDADRQAMQQTSDGMGSGGKLSLDLESMTIQTLDGVTYYCAPIKGGIPGGETCLWNDGKTEGEVVWFADRGAPIEFASHVHDAVVS